MDLISWRTRADSVFAPLLHLRHFAMKNREMAKKSGKPDGTIGKTVECTQQIVGFARHSSGRKRYFEPGPFAELALDLQRASHAERQGFCDR